MALKKRKAGRPEVESEQVTLRFASELLLAIDRYRQKTLPIPNRQDIIRDVMTAWARENGLLK